MDPIQDADTTGTAEDAIQPLQDEDATMPADPSTDPAQAEWDATTAIDRGEEPDLSTATGHDPAEIPDADDEIPAEDLHGSAPLPESQGDDPVIAELGEMGEGDLAPEDV